MSNVNAANGLVSEDQREEDKEAECDRKSNNKSQGDGRFMSESSFGGQGDDDYQEAIQRATSVRVEKLQSMMRSKHDMYQVLHSMRKLETLFIINHLFSWTSSSKLYVLSNQVHAWYYVREQESKLYLTISPGAPRSRS